MASLFKRLFSSGGTQTASWQFAEPSAEAAVAEETIEQAASQYQVAELKPPSEEELKEFLYKNFLDGAKPAEVPQAQEWKAANSPAVNAELAPTITPEEVDSTSLEETASNNQVCTEEADAAEVRVGDSTETESFVDEILAPAQDETLATKDVVAISDPETIPQAEVAAHLASLAIAPATALLTSEDEM